MRGGLLDLPRDEADEETRTKSEGANSNAFNGPGTFHASEKKCSILSWDSKLLLEVFLGFLVLFAVFIKILIGILEGSQYSLHERLKRVDIHHCLWSHQRASCSESACQPSLRFGLP